MENDLALTRYAPVSELKVPAHEAPRPKFEAIDVHTHWGVWPLDGEFRLEYDLEGAISALRAAGVAHVVNLDGWWGETTEKMLRKVGLRSDFITTFGSVDVTGLNGPGFEKAVRDTIARGVELGIKGLKFLKDVSLGLRDDRGEFIRADSPRLQVIWRTAAEFGLPVLIHIADPVAFFKPFDRFNERYEELLENPDWSFHGGGRFSFGELMEMQDNLLESNPETTFVIAHVGSCAEDLALVSAMLDRHPNMYIDTAARISELGRQPYTAGAFLEKYQDRVLFGTDTLTAYAGALHHPVYYRCFETRDEYFDYHPEGVPSQGRWKIYGMGLGDAALEKIYSLNAKKLLGLRG